MHQNVPNGSICFIIFLEVPPLQDIFSFFHHNPLPCLDFTSPFRLDDIIHNGQQGPNKSHRTLNVQQWLPTSLSWLRCLTHRGRDKMAAIFQKTFSNAFSWMKMYKFRLRFHCLKFVPNRPVKNIPALVEIMAWRRPGGKPFLRFTNVYMRHTASMS